MGEAYVGTIIRYSQEVSRWFGRGPEVVSWFDVFSRRMTTHLFQFRFADTDAILAPKLVHHIDVLQD